ncbi:MAG: HDIG domain-containing protein [Chloroflexota bacterium]
MGFRFSRQVATQGERHIADTNARRALRLASGRGGSASRSSRIGFVANGALLVTLLVILFNVEADATSSKVGQTATDTVVAQRRVTYVDTVATRVRQRQAQASTPTVYKTDAAAARTQVQAARQFLAGIAPTLESSTSTRAKLHAIQQYLPAWANASDLQQLAALSPADFRVVQRHSLALLTQAEAWQFDQNQISTTAVGLVNTLGSRVNAQQREATQSLLSAFLRPTWVPDIPATLQRAQSAATRVVPVTNTVNAGEIVVQRGELVTPSVMEKLVALGVQGRKNGWQDISGSLFFSAAIIAMLFWYLHATGASAVTNPRLLILIDASILLTVVGARLFTAGHALLPYFLPVAAASTFAAVLMAPEACVAMTFAMAVLAGWVVANSFELSLYYFLSGTAGVLAVRQVRQLKQFIFAGFYMTGFALVTALAFQLVDRSYGLVSLEQHAAAAIFNGFVSCTLALGGFTILSDFFGVTTMLQLLELGQPSHPLLRRLMVNAPGTYNHSLLLGTMVERAAEEIGANALGAKVGALYHDVGKSVNAECFVENQLGIGNVHDQLRPEESARIIRGHVSHGMRLARHSKMPRVILDAIAEHHGTMTIGFFLHKARELHPDESIDAALYMYPGPKPQSKETALIMLADACESAVRASSDHSHTRIADIVRKIFNERVDQGQLDDCPLTLKDLDRARVSFCSVLNGLYHPRIEYPDAAEPEPVPVIGLRSKVAARRADTS